MASTPATPQLPLFYKSLTALSSVEHPTHGLVARNSVPFASSTHAIPITVQEFPTVQRHYPIVFSLGDNPVPLALVGLHEGSNLFVDAEGRWQPGTYLPAFVRRYPFMLVKPFADRDELTLFFDETAGLVTAEGETKLFDGGAPTETTQGILAFCQQFEGAAAQTHEFMNEMAKLDLLMDGEVTIQQPGLAEPAKYRGFRMISEEKFLNIRGDKARQLVQNGMMGLIYAHLFSLGLIANLFEKQQQAKA